MGVVIGAVAVVFVLALIIFPGVRGKLKVLVGGFLNIFVEDIAKTPEGAKAVFQQAIVQSAKAIRSDINKSLYTMILWCLMSCDRCAANLYGVKS